MIFNTKKKANTNNYFLSESACYRLLFSVLCLILLSTSFHSYAQDIHTDTDWSLYTKKGADTCLKCHDEDNKVPILPIFSTQHGQLSKGSPMAGLQCESCHGPGAAHVKSAKSDQGVGAIINFGMQVSTPVDEQNKQCLLCHNERARSHWVGSAHENNDVSCAGCHQIHAVRDRVLVNDQQSDVCFSCHKTERAKIHKRSAHPIVSNEMTCSSCHNPHGSVTDGLLSKASINETCTSCHAEKRGPVLWQHAPVDEDCTLCHEPHGSNHPDLLVQRTSMLCRQCHVQVGHSSTAPSGTELPGGRHSGRSRFVVGKSCLNCHSQIHGSNHPSGAKFMR